MLALTVPSLVAVRLVVSECARPREISGDANKTEVTAPIVAKFDEKLNPVISCLPVKFG